MRRGLIQPLRIIDEAQQRLAGGHIGQQAQHRQPDQETIRRAARLQSERHSQSLALRPRQPVQAIQHPPAQLMQRRERQLHLRLDTLSAGHLEIGSRVGRIPQQSGLPDTRLTTHDQHAAPARAHIRDQPIQDRARQFATP